MNGRSRSGRGRPNSIAAHRCAVIVLLAATLPSACTNHGASEPTLEREPGSEQEPPIEALATSTVSPSRGRAPVWRWSHRPGEGGWSADIGPKQIQAGDFTCAFDQAQPDAAGEVCCEGPARRWCAEMQQDFVPGISLASDGRWLFVADYPAISTGARIAAHELETGELRWTRDALAIGVRDHSKYSNVVQLRLIDGTLIAYGNEAFGAYVEAMDPASGELREHATLERPKVDWRWRDGPEPGPVVELALSDGGGCRFEARERGPAQLRCDPTSARAWTREIEDQLVGRGALVSDGRRVVLVTWSPIANGARARAWTLTDGALAWDRSVEGIGPQNHSQYSNLIELELIDDLVVVRGQESHGRYAEALELASGALRWTVSW